MEKSSNNPAISSRKSPKEEKNFFKTNLKWFRENQSQSQQSLSEATGISRAAIGSYEEGRAQPRTAALIVLADHFGVRVDELVREASRATVVDDTDFKLFANANIVINRFISRSELYEAFCKIVPKTTPQSFKNQLHDWCKENGYTLNPNDFTDKHGRIIVRHGGKAAEFFFIQRKESEVPNEN